MRAKHAKEKDMGRKWGRLRCGRPGLSIALFVFGKNGLLFWGNWCLFRLEDGLRNRTEDVRGMIEAESRFSFVLRPVHSFGLYMTFSFLYSLLVAIAVPLLGAETRSWMV